MNTVQESLKTYKVNATFFFLENIYHVLHWELPFVEFDVLREPGCGPSPNNGLLGEL